MLFDVRQKLNVASDMMNETVWFGRRNKAEVTFRILNDKEHLDDRHTIDVRYDESEDFYNSLATVLHLAVTDSADDDIDLFAIDGIDDIDMNRFMEVYESEYQRNYSTTLVDEYAMYLVNNKKTLDTLTTEIKSNIKPEDEEDENESKGPMIDVTGELDMDRLIKSNKDWRFKMPFYARKRLTVDFGIRETFVNEVGICDEFNQLKQYGFRTRCSHRHLRNITRYLQKTTKNEGGVVGKNDTDIKAMKILQHYIKHSPVGYNEIDEWVGLDVFFNYMRFSGRAITKDKVVTKIAGELLADRYGTLKRPEDEIRLILYAAMNAPEGTNTSHEFTPFAEFVEEIIRKDSTDSMCTYDNLSLNILAMSYEEKNLDTLRNLFRVTGGTILFNYASPAIKNASGFHHIISTLKSKRTTVKYMVETICENFTRYTMPERMGVLPNLIAADPDLKFDGIGLRELHSLIEVEKTKVFDVDNFAGASSVNANLFNKFRHIAEVTLTKNGKIININKDIIHKMVDKFDVSNINEKYVRIMANALARVDARTLVFAIEQFLSKNKGPVLKEIFNPVVFSVYRSVHICDTVSPDGIAGLMEEYNYNDYSILDVFVNARMHVSERLFNKIYANGTICPSILQTDARWVMKNNYSRDYCDLLFKNCEEARNMAFFPHWFIEEHAQELFNCVTNAEGLSMRNKAVGYINIINAVGLNKAEKLGRIPVAEIIECDKYRSFDEEGRKDNVVKAPTFEFFVRYLDIAVMDEKANMNIGVNIGYHLAFDYSNTDGIRTLFSYILDADMFTVENKAKTFYMMMDSFDAASKLMRAEVTEAYANLRLNNSFFREYADRIKEVCLNDNPAKEGLWASRLHRMMDKKGLID